MGDLVPQLHLYVPEEIAERLREQASDRQMSLSRYLAAIVQDAVSSGWPDDYFETVFGGWQGELRRPEQPETEERLQFDPGSQG